MDLCVICKTNIAERLSKVTDVGLETLRTACQLRHRGDICQFLDSTPNFVFVHSSCRKSFTRSTDLKRLKLQLEETKKPQAIVQSFAQVVVLCGKQCASCVHSLQLVVLKVRGVCTFELIQKILAQCAQRSDGVSGVH